MFYLRFEPCCLHEMKNRVFTRNNVFTRFFTTMNLYHYPYIGIKIPI
nr:MAG TPA: hypothetical protein [Caudoviricetes sp.]